MLETDEYFKSSAAHFKAAEAEFIAAEESLRALKSRLDNSLVRLNRLSGYNPAFGELHELLYRHRTGLSGQLRPAKA